MTRMETTTRTIYQFDELSDSAKECALDSLLIEPEEYAESVIEDANRAATILGIAFDSKPVKLMGGGTRYEPKVYWSGFSSQGDGASFVGSYAYAKGAAKAIRAYAPQDTRLHAIADALQAAQKKNAYKLTADVSLGHRSGSYYHAHTMDIKVRCDSAWQENESEQADDVREALRDFANWIYRMLEAEHDYHTSPEIMAENIRANGYEFTEEGRLA